MILTLFLGLAASTATPTGGDGIAMAKRVVAAIKGEAQFQDSDFVRPLAVADKAALQPFAACKVTNIAYALVPDPKERDTYSEDPNFVGVGLDCKGVPAETPVGISLHLKDGKIATIETHNADLMRKQ
jgi:hypothetical protein